MNIDLRLFRYFIAVAEELHFGRAAERLFIAQPPLSQQIQKLERELGVKLFHRTRRHVELTPAGQIFLEEAKRAIAQSQRAVDAARRAQRGEIGRLAVGFVGSATYQILAKPLHCFRRRYPDVEFHLQELTTGQQIVAIRNQTLDVGFVRPPINDPALSVKTLVEEEFMLAVAETHPLAGNSEIDLVEVSDHPFILYPRYIGPSLYDPVVSACQLAGFSPKVVQEATQMHTILSLVETGFGVALVPECVQASRWSGVAFKRLKQPAPKTSIALSWLSGNRSTVLQCFLDSVEADPDSSGVIG